MVYELEPFDNLFFRSSAPFEAGGETISYQSGFPPLPSAYAGAFKELSVSSDRGSRGIAIGYSGIKLNGSHYFPLPRDLYVHEPGEDGKEILRLKRLKMQRLSSFPLDYMLYAPEEMEKEKKQKNLYISEKDMNVYLHTDGGSWNCTDINPYLMVEKKLGIEEDYASGTSRKGRLYEISCIRPDSLLKLEVEIKNGLVKESGVVKLGGENKKAFFAKTDKVPNFQWGLEEECYFKLYLATPSVFKGGWVPGWIDNISHTGCFSYRKRQVKVKLLGACVGRPVLCGGFGYMKGERQYRPRELRYAVPAGSVYYFKLLKGSFEDAVKLFHGKCISEYRENMGFEYQVFNRSRYCDRGFGYALLGKVSREQEEILNV